MSSELEKDKACLSAVKTLTKTFEEVDKHNIKVRSDTATALENWKSEKAVYEAYLSRWVAKSDEYAVWNKFDGKSHDFWASGYDGTCWWGRNDQSGDQWCKEVGDHKGLDGGNYRALEWRNCQGRKDGDFKCAKPDDIQRNQQQDYQNVKPVFNNPEPKFSDFGGLREHPQNNTIFCCSNSTNINNTEFKTITQSCTNELNKKISKSTVPAPVTSPTALDNDTSNLSPPLSDPLRAQTIDNPSQNDNTVILLILILILLIFSSSISLAVSGFLFLG